LIYRKQGKIRETLTAMYHAGLPNYFTQWQPRTQAEALEVYNTALEIGADPYLVYLNIGVAYGNGGNWALVAEPMRRALALNPRSMVAHAYLAEHYRLAGNNLQARAEAEAAIAGAERHHVALTLAEVEAEVIGPPRWSSG
jgi:tetratricopeptide (TPR) repeat protein